MTHYNLDATNILFRLRREQRIGWRAVGLGQVIASFANKDDGEAWPSRARLSAITGIAPRHVSGTIRELEQAGFLTAVEREGQSNIYRLTLDQIGTPAISAPLTKSAPTLDVLVSKLLTKKAPITIEEQSKNKDVCAERQKQPSPKVEWDGSRLVVPNVFLTSWSESHPHVDLRAAIRKASSWCLANPGKRPKKDFARFLNGWFGRVRPGDPEYIDPDEQAANDAELIRGAEETFPDPDERADFFWVRKQKGLRVPPGVDCRPMPDALEDMRQAKERGAAS